MIEENNQDIIVEKLNKNPFISMSALTNIVPCSSRGMKAFIKNLADSGNENAQIWIETIYIRRYWKGFRNVLQLFAYVFKRGLTIEDVEKMDLWNSVDSYSENGSILSILKPKPHHQRRYKTLLNTKKVTTELMEICGEYGPTGERIRYKLTSEQIEHALRKYGI